MSIRDGRTKHPNYRIWVGMRQRCRENWRHYEHVSVHPSWDDFWQFVADVGERPAGLTLDRIDSSGDYEPGNVRWATYSEQNRNRRGWVQAVPDTCSKGHDYEPVYDSSGNRRCASCVQEHNRERSLADFAKRQQRVKEKK